MSYSNRPGKFGDPTVAPSALNNATGKRALRDPFTPSPYREAQQNASREARKRNRKGVSYHGAK